MFNPEEVAEAEIGWWKSHHERNYAEVIEQMTTVYEKLFDLDRKIAEKVVLLRIEAAKEHDLAERDNISKRESEVHWSKAKELMIQHFSMLKEALKKKNATIATQKNNISIRRKTSRKPFRLGNNKRINNTRTQPIKIP